MSEIVSAAPVPADVRADGAHGRKLYEAALGFEEQLVRSLTAQLAATADPDETDADSDDDTSGDVASGVIRDQLPDALADGITSAGGLGLAHELYLAMRRTGK